MKINSNIFELYAITDRSWLKGRSLCEVVEEALKGGVTILQIREKDLDEASFLAEAKKVKKVCDKYKVPLIINDNAIVALKCDAFGVHVGQSDEKIDEVRAKLGNNKVIGVSVRTLEQALEAENLGADYLGVGAIFTTNTKSDAKSVSIEVLKEICKSVKIPVVAIGGINEDNLSMLKDTGIAGPAVISAIFSKKEIRESANRISKHWKE